MQYCLLSSDNIGLFQDWTPSAATVVNEDVTVNGCLTRRNVVRRACCRIVTHRYIICCWVVLVCISTALALAVQPRYDMGDATYKTLFALQVVCLAFFWLRMLTEMMASGLVEGQHSFLRSAWNWVELAVNVFGILQVIPPTWDIQWMRAFAAARPLRFFVLCPLWQSLLLPLGRGFPYVFDAFILYAFSIVALGLVGVFTIGERLYQLCYITDVLNGTNSNYADLALPYALHNVTGPCGGGYVCPNLGKEVMVECLSRTLTSPSQRYFTYQNIGTALLLMLKVTASDMWFENLEDAMVVKGPPAALYLVVVAAVGALLKVFGVAVVFRLYSVLGTRYLKPMESLTEEAPLEQKDAATQIGARDARNPLSYSHNNPTEWSSSGQVTRNNGQGYTAHSSTQRESPMETGHTRSFLRVLRSDGLVAAVQILEQTTRPPHGRLPYVRWAATVLHSVPFVLFLLVLSVTNVVLLLLVNVYMSASHMLTLRQTSSAMALFFVTPLVLRWLAFGVRATAMDAWNTVDLLGVVSGILEFAHPSLFDHPAVGLLRVLRFLRVGKYVFAFQQRHYQLGSLFQLLLLCTALLLLYALAGMQLFGMTYAAPIEGEGINGDFSSAWTALLACFRAFTGDVWTRYLTAAGIRRSVATSSLFFVTLRLFQVLLVFCLEHAVLFRGFCEAIADEEALDFVELPPLLLLPPVHEVGSGTAVPVRVGAANVSPDTAVDGAGKHLRGTRRRLFQEHWMWAFLKPKRLYGYGTSLFWFSTTNALRVALLRFLGSFAYLVLSTLCVLLGFAALFFEREYLDAYTERVLWIVNIVYVIFFMMEMVAKWIAYGLITYPRRDDDEEDVEGGITGGRSATIGGYFTSPLNIIDLAVNVLSFAAIWVSFLRVGRILRTVRLVTTQEHVNTAFVALIRSLPRVVKVLPLIFALYVAFAVAGMQIFAGKMHTCSDTSVRTQVACVGVFNRTVSTYTGTSTELQQRVWHRASFHYDAFGPALLSVFAMTTVTHYGPFMDTTMAVGGSDESLSPNHAGYYVLFCIAALLTIRFYALRGVSAMLVATLHPLLLDTAGLTLLTAPQRRFEVSRPTLNFMLRVRATIPPCPFTISRLCHHILTAYPLSDITPVFHAALNGALAVVCGFLVSTHLYQPQWQSQMLLALESVGVAVCGVELLLSFVAYGPPHFMRLSRVVDVVLFALMVVGVSSSVLCFLRVALLARFIKASNVAMLLLPALRHTKVLCSAASLYLMVLLCYAVVGTLMFGDIAPHGAYLTESRNFKTVIGSLLMLFDCSSFDQWAQVMLACGDGAWCRSDSNKSCGSRYQAVPFFVSFVAVTNLLVLQLLFAAVVTVVTVGLHVDVVSPLLQVRRVWMQVVGAGEVHCSFEQLLRLLPLLPRSLTGWMPHREANQLQLLRFLTSLRLPLDAQLRLRYQDLLSGLAYRKYKLDLMEWEVEQHQRHAALSLMAGEYYGQRLRQEYCDAVLKMSQAKVDAVPLVDATSTSGASRLSANEQELLQHFTDDYSVPRGVLRVPTSNVFLFTLPGEGTHLATPPSPTHSP